MLMLSAFAVIAVMAHRKGPRSASAASSRTRSAAGDGSLRRPQGFTTFAEHHEPAAVSRMLNTHFSAAIPAVEQHHGDVDRLIGDAVFATFKGEKHPTGRPAPRSPCRRKAVAPLAAEHPEWPRFRAGLNSGEARVGVLGTGSGRTYSASATPSTSVADRGARAGRRSRNQRRDRESALGRGDGATRNDPGEGPDQPVEVLLLAGCRPGRG